MCRRSPNRRHRRVACIQCAYTPILRVLYNKEETYVNTTSQPLGTQTGCGTLTSQYNTKENSNNEIKDGHAYDDAENSDIFRFARAMACIPESFANEIDTEYKDESADYHDGEISDGGCARHHNNRGDTCEKKPG